MWAKVWKKIEQEQGIRQIPVRSLQQNNILEHPAAQAIISAAQDRAAAILEEVQQEALVIKEGAVEAQLAAVEQGRAAGAAQGYKEGKAQAEAEVAELRREAKELREQAEQVLAEAKSVFQESVAQAEDAIIELALTVAARVIGDEVAERPEIVARTARQAIRRVASGQAYTIFAHPAAAQLLHEQRAELLAEAPPGARLQVIADPQLAPGACRVETERGFVDAGVDTQLQAVRALLRGEAV